MISTTIAAREKAIISHTGCFRFWGSLCGWLIEFGDDISPELDMAGLCWHSSLYRTVLKQQCLVEIFEILSEP
jgi:hypothetical protein